MSSLGSSLLNEPTAVARIIRSYQDQLANLSDRTVLIPPADGLAVVGKTASDGSYPTTAQAVYMLVLQSIDVGDSEGDAATFFDEDGLMPAVNLGGSIPPAGTRVIAFSISGHWVFSY